MQLLPDLAFNLGLVVTSGPTISSHAAVTVEQNTHLFPAYLGISECVVGICMGDNMVFNKFSLLNDIINYGANA